MRALVYFLFLITLLAIGYQLRRSQTQGGQWDGIPLESSTGTSLNLVVAQFKVSRDEYGAVIISDPADDLGGFQAPEGSSVNTSVGERALHLGELYGTLSLEQLAGERLVLQRRLETERALTLKPEDDGGLRELRDALEWLDRRLGEQ